MRGDDANVGLAGREDAGAVGAHEAGVAIALGSEGAGLARLTRESCDVLVRLPMRGRVASLNASASLAAALYAFVLPGRVKGSASA